MEEYVRKHLSNQVEAWGFEPTDDNIHELLISERAVYKEMYEQHRHWDEYLYVVEIDGMMVGYIDEYATGDLAGDMGYEFDVNTVCEMVPVTETVTKYIRKAT